MILAHFIERFQSSLEEKVLELLCEARAHLGAPCMGPGQERCTGNFQRSAPSNISSKQKQRQKGCTITNVAPPVVGQLITMSHEILRILVANFDCQINYAQNRLKSKFLSTPVRFVLNHVV